MGRPPAKRQLRRQVQGLAPDGPLQTGTSVNHRWVGAVNRAIQERNPTHLSYGNVALFGDDGFVGAELFGYPESHVGPLLCALIVAEREGWPVVERLRERAEDLLSAYALFLPQSPGLPLVPVGHRQGWIVATAGGDVQEDSTESMALTVRMAISGKVEGGKSLKWLGHDDHLAAWAMTMLAGKPHQPRIYSDWQWRLGRVRAHLGLTVSLLYVRHEHGWRAHLSEPHPNPDLRPYDNPHYAVASGPGGVRVLSPTYSGVEAWPLEPARVQEIPGGYRASCRVERERSTPRARVEQWSSDIRWDDLGLGPELGRWQLAGPGRAPWKFDGSAPPPPPPVEEEPVPEDPELPPREYPHLAEARAKAQELHGRLPKGKDKRLAHEVRAALRQHALRELGLADDAE
jgi:hypothetical protein